MSSEKSLATQPPASEQTTAKVIESLVLRGDISGLNPRDRAQYYVQQCESLGLNPNAQPFAFLRLNGKEILYATRGATDQLAAIHRITREIIDGPKVIDLSGTKLVICVARASHPNGRTETSVATVPLMDPQNVLMKAETKAKRRVTLSILGLALLDEMELETIPANVQQPGGGVDLSLAEKPGQQPAVDVQAEASADVVESEKEAPASRAYATFLDRLSGAQTLVAVFTLYAALLTGLREEGNDPQSFVSGNDGAAAQVRDHIKKRLQHRLSNAEALQVLLSRALAEILDDQAGIQPGPQALQEAATWWVRNRERVVSLDPAHRQAPWYALVRRYSGSAEGPATKAAAKALDSAVKLLSPPPTGGGNGTQRGGAANGQGDAREVAPQGEAAQACGALGEFRAHISGLPERGEDRGAARVAGGYWKRRADFLDEGTHAEAMGVVIDELTRRGVKDPGSWLTRIGIENGCVAPAQHEAA